VGRDENASSSKSSYRTSSRVALLAVRTSSMKEVPTKTTSLWSTSISLPCISMFQRIFILNEMSSPGGDFLASKRSFIIGFVKCCHSFSGAGWFCEEGEEYEREYLVSINEAVVVVESDMRKV